MQNMKTLCIKCGSIVELKHTKCELFNTCIVSYIIWCVVLIHSVATCIVGSHLECTNLISQGEFKLSTGSVFWPWKHGDCVVCRQAEVNPNSWRETCWCSSTVETFPNTLTTRLWCSSGPAQSPTLDSWPCSSDAEVCVCLWLKIHL